eukprot:4170834-Pleurochrysis_carterae.AAC.1
MSPPPVVPPSARRSCVAGTPPPPMRVPCPPRPCRARPAGVRSRRACTPPFRARPAAHARSARRPRW